MKKNANKIAKIMLAIMTTLSLHEAAHTAVSLLLGYKSIIQIGSGFTLCQIDFDYVVIRYKIFCINGISEIVGTPSTIDALCILLAGPLCMILPLLWERYNANGLMQQFTKVWNLQETNFWRILWCTCIIDGSMSLIPLTVFDGGKIVCQIIKLANPTATFEMYQTASCYAKYLILLGIAWYILKKPRSGSWAFAYYNIQ